jgi:pre-mycofactocin synthase
VVGVEIQSERGMATSVLGQDISLPVVIPPAAAQAIHPDGEVAVAEGAARTGTAIGQSN